MSLKPRVASLPLRQAGRAAEQTDTQASPVVCFLEQDCQAQGCTSLLWPHVQLSIPLSSVCMRLKNKASNVQKEKRKEEREGGRKKGRVLGPASDLLNQNLPLKYFPGELYKRESL